MSLVHVGCAPARSAPVAIHESEFGHIWRLLRHLGVNGPSLEDAVQEVFVVAHARLDTFDSSRPLRPWLFGIAVRVACELRRAERRRISAPDALLPEIAPDPEQQLATHEVRAIVRDALDRLDADQRKVLVLHDIEGLSAPEIAVTLSAPLNTIYSRLRLGRAKIAALVRHTMVESQRAMTFRRGQ